MKGISTIVLLQLHTTLRQTMQFVSSYTPYESAITVLAMPILGQHKLERKFETHRICAISQTACFYAHTLYPKAHRLQNEKAELMACLNLIGIPSML